MALGASASSLVPVLVVLSSVTTSRKKQCSMHASKRWHRLSARCCRGPPQRPAACLAGLRIARCTVGVQESWQELGARYCPPPGGLNTDPSASRPHCAHRTRMCEACRPASCSAHQLQATSEICPDHSGTDSERLRLHGTAPHRECMWASSTAQLEQQIACPLPCSEWSRRSTTAAAYMGMAHTHVTSHHGPGDDDADDARPMMMMAACSMHALCHMPAQACAARSQVGLHRIKASKVQNPHRPISACKLGSQRCCMP